MPYRNPYLDPPAHSVQHGTCTSHSSECIRMLMSSR